MKEPFDNFFKNCFWKRIEYHPEDNAHEYERSQAKSDCLSDNSPIVAEDKQFAFAVDLKKKETAKCGRVHNTGRIWILQVKNSSFNPLVFTWTGGTGPTASRVLKRFAAKICKQIAKKNKNRTRVKLPENRYEAQRHNFWYRTGFRVKILLKRNLHFWKTLNSSRTD